MATMLNPKTNIVRVCGRRTNATSPQSWWIDTGIYVKTGNSLTIDASKTTTLIKPWPSHPGFNPSGEVGNTVDRDWSEALANRTGITPGDTNCWFGSLIGKIGRDGKAFSIGKLRTLNVPVNGTLFLAFNDGSSFEDNSGIWDVSVTFEAKILLGSYDTNLIFADRINTSLVDDWGIILTIESDLATLGIAWNKAATDNLVAAFSSIQSRLFPHARKSFKQVYAGLEIRFIPTDVAGDTTNPNGRILRFGTQTQSTTPQNTPRLDNRLYGRITPACDVRCPDLNYYPTTGYGFFLVADKGIQNTVIHELGHIISYRTNSNADSMSVAANPLHMNLKQMPDAAWLDAADSTNDVGTFWEHPSSDLAEQVADNFLNWVRDSYVGIEGTIDTHLAGTGTSEQQRVTAYWQGGILFNNYTSPGINGFGQQAAAYIDNTIAPLLRSFGLGEVDPNCMF